MYDVNILLEEISREDFKLQELWSTSEHTIKLKNLFLNNQQHIHDIDIRPYLVPFSWELVNKNDEQLKLNDYLIPLFKFLYIKSDILCKKIRTF